MLVACTRRLYAVGSSPRGGAVSLRSGVKSRVSQSSASSSAYAGVSSKSSLVKVALRKYADATEAEAATKKWNIELNRLFKLRYYEQASEQYKKMKEAGVTPNTLTYSIMYDTYGMWQDGGAMAALVDEVKARGVKSYLVDKAARLQELLEDDSREADLESAEINSQLNRYKQAGLNPFDPLK